jgi:predicted kinase
MVADQRQNSAQKASLLVVFGLPGTGKTTFARALAEQLGQVHLNTDIIRSELGKKGQYDNLTKSAIYGQMLRRAREELQKGNSVILDGTFSREAFRDPFTGLGREFGFPVKWIEIRAGEEVVRERVSATRPYSEADFGVYRKIRGEFEPLKGGEVLTLHSDSGDLPAMLAKAVEFLSA